MSHDVPSMPEVLIVEDSEDYRQWLAMILARAGFKTILAEDGEVGLARLRERVPDAIILDIQLPVINGFEVLSKINPHEVPVIVLTGYATTEGAVRAIKAGAYDYLTKPIKKDDLLATVRRAIQQKTLGSQIAPERDPELGRLSLLDLMGSSAGVRRLADAVSRVAPTSLSVLVVGETGTGKELVSRAIHTQSSRSMGPFIPLDCGAIPESLMESELFGHEKGAFTGAHQSFPGAFQLAHEGTLFLDEIGNLPQLMQAKLLRVLEDKQVRRLGSRSLMQVDVRVVAATNVDLRAMVERKVLRQDLYHRLAEFTIRLPPLRERKEDIPFLVNRFLASANRETGKNVTELSAGVRELLQSYDWPGNVRELRNMIRQALVQVSETTQVLEAEAIMMQHHRLPTASSSVEDASASAPEAGDWERDAPRSRVVGNRPWHEPGTRLKDRVKSAVAQVERDILIHILKETTGNVAEAARRLQVDYKTLHGKLKTYRISAAPFRIKKAD